MAYSHQCHLSPTVAKARILLEAATDRTMLQMGRIVLRLGNSQSPDEIRAS